MTNHQIVIGDSRNMSCIGDKSVQLIVTSPPYWQLKDYGDDEQIGFNDSYDEYINNLNLVWQECYRVLAEGCRLCINIGDQFARSVYYGRYKVIPIRTEIIRFCETLGLDYMGAIIWQKTTTMNTSGGGAVMGSFPYPRNGILKIDYEFILIFKKAGKAPKPTADQKQRSVISKEDWNSFFSSHWHFNGVKQVRHIAMFPEELPRRLIQMFTFADETVLDPFAGSGTTSLAAAHLGRNSIGYEINAEFLPIIYEKLNDDPSIKNGEATIQYCTDSNRHFSYESLPYIFHDPHHMDKKVDIKELSFGSKISKEPLTQTELYSVKCVLSPEIIILNNGLKIRLLGVKTIDEKRTSAIEFLQKKFKGRRIYFKYDEKISIEDGDIPSCYVYLDNRTFVNRHLIKSGFVAVDTAMDYKYKNKFIQDAEELHHA